MTLVLVAAVLVPIAAILPLGGQGATTPVAGNDTYVLRHLRLEYPYRARSGNAYTEDPTRVGVHFGYEWSGSSFPGEARCVIRVFTGEGEEIGRRAFTMESLAPSAGQGTFTNGLPVDVGERVPERATGGCDPGRKPRGAYEFSDLRIEPRPGSGLRVVGDIAWAGGVNPGTHWCVAVFNSTTGVTRRAFTLSVPRRRNAFVAAVPEDVSDPTHVTVTCEPFTGHNGG